MLCPTLFSPVKNLLSLTPIAHLSWLATKKSRFFASDIQELREKKSCRAWNGHLKRENYAGCVRYGFRQVLFLKRNFLKSMAKKNWPHSWIKWISDTTTLFSGIARNMPDLKIQDHLYILTRDWSKEISFSFFYVLA